MDIVALITAAGKGTRMGADKNKLLITAGTKTILEHTVEKFSAYEDISRIVIAAAAEDIGVIKQMFCACPKPVTVTEGGNTRTKSVFNGLKAIEGGCDIVLIHDGARPFVSANIIKCCIDDVKKYGSAVTAVPVTDTVKKADSGFRIISSVDRSDLYAVQTPQGFIYKDILNAYLKAGENECFTDDSSVYEKYSGAPYICMGETSNIKITYSADLQNFFKGERCMKSGIGYDSHRFAQNRKFILGGAAVPSDMGLIGHSDADALSHAVIDSLLSAAGLPDIGSYFPDTAAEYKDADSIVLLTKCREIIKEKGCTPVSVSAVIICEKPKLAPYIGEMKKNIARALNISEDGVGISAKTNEGMGWVGTSQGVAVIANCTISKM